MKNDNWLVEVINLDISTYCNAKCPHCGRENDWLPSVNWSMQDFNKAFSDSDLRSIKHISFCPNYGDPLMNPHLFEMLERCFDVNRKMSISLHTNGSIRSEEWWWKLPRVLKNKKQKLETIFTVDGLDQEMHERYRVNTKLDKVLNNMKAFSDSSIAKTTTQTIVFKHNEDYLEEIKQMCFDHGSTKHINLVGDRFGVKRFLKKENIGVEERTKKLKNEKITHENKSDEIVCLWKKNNSLLVSYSGQVFPCCYLTGHLERKIEDENIKRHEVENEYIKNKAEYNIFNDSLDNIIKKIWYKETLPNSWTKSPLHPCKVTCKKNTVRHYNEFDKE